MLTFNRKLLLTLTSIIAITIMPACKHDSKEINELLKIEKLNESDPKAALEPYRFNPTGKIQHS